MCRNTRPSLRTQASVEELQASQKIRCEVGRGEEERQEEQEERRRVSGVESVNTCRREDQSLEQVGQRDDPSHHVVAVHQHQAVNLEETR